MSTPHVLYRHYDADGRLLYVGITNDPGRRWEQHRSKAWWSDVETTKLQHFDSRAAVLAAEKWAIVAEKPRWNAAGNAAGIAYWQRVEESAVEFAEDLPILHPELLAGLTEGCRRAYLEAFAREVQLIIDYERDANQADSRAYAEATRAAHRAFEEAGDVVGFAWSEKGGLDGSTLTNFAAERDVRVLDFYAEYRRVVAEGSPFLYGYNILSYGYNILSGKEGLV